MAERNLYEVLGVSRSAGADEMRRSYKRLAMKYHPDRNSEPDAEARFKEIQHAYSVLSDEQKRAMYDRFGTTEGPQFGAGQQHGFGDGAFGDIFDTIFGGFGAAEANRTSASRTRGRDLQIDLDLTLEQAAAGIKREVRVTAYDSCEDCHSTGITPGSSTVACESCGGSGMLHQKVAFMTIQQPCARCRGLGTIAENPCAKCSGSGRVRRKRTIPINVPAGIDSEDVLRLRGKGEVGSNGGEAGDLLVRVRIKKHPIFQRSGDNLHCTIPISYAAAALGGKLEIPTLDKKPKTITVPKGIQSGEQLRVRAAGIKGLRSLTPGDLLCTMTVETPQNLSDAQIKKLREFDSSLSKSNAPRYGSWLEKAKRLFS